MLSTMAYELIIIGYLMAHILYLAFNLARLKQILQLILVY